ncbi:MULTISPECIES: hypothetical protein [Bacillus]|jgi:hypothetical protein|uniref:Uncharacterized protein n=1 Tax=Bacillus thuringiensis serovar kumamotoensis TaxID=132267 RepID=A0A9X6JPK7_BACUK|nr:MULTISPECIES: hypothetical protein [Bacillus cereus group]MBQ2637057.1 hypothetical protein [Methanobrevibacter sp.]MBQ9658954.1 hypothetical protein [Clostridia bacterium]EEK91808.1 hypothetical protein bcere0012_52740 [Bacillus cereus BDRD-ST24]MBQ6349432.1 hypothetical protein [Methanobrevibacter sp.]MCC2397399.1 hypothetical protein [Bacillus cereus]
MSILQSHFESRRRYIVDRLKQPGYEEQSIQWIQKAKKEIAENLEEMIELLFLDAEDEPCLPPIACFMVKELQTNKEYQTFATMTDEQLQKLNQVDREEILESTLQIINEITNLQRTMFVMLHQNKEDILIGFYQKNPQKYSTLHYDENDRHGFDKSIYQKKIRSLQNDIRVVSFKKFCSNEPVPNPENLEAFKNRYETVVLPKVQEIVSLIEPNLVKLDIFLNPVIQYGVGQIGLKGMLKRLDENLTALHEISKVEYCPTLEMTVKEYLFLEAMNNAGKVKELQPSK